MADANNHSFSPSSLFCRETEACFDGEDEEEEEEEEEDDDRPVYSIYCDNPCFVVAENEGEFIENLVQRETMSFGSRMKVDDCSRTSLSWLKCARLDAIEWIFNTRAVFGFQHHTAYLSITFLDRFLSRRSIEVSKTETELTQCNAVLYLPMIG
ncbi:cyclin-D5-1-like [Carica papaya]|uniref:cyclin-D5-1-like n=1 Tax=Carica papaya TaxID=3649 RepID=UPI000B8C8374|nr:cyclin-D5-1-like [Carica papaya]